MATAALPCAGQSIAVLLGTVVVVVVVVDVGTVVVVDVVGVVVVVATGTVVVVVVVVVLVVGGMIGKQRPGRVLVVDESAGLSWADVEEAVVSTSAALIPSERSEPRRIQWEFRRATTKMYSVRTSRYVHHLCTNAILAPRCENSVLSGFDDICAGVRA